MKTEDVISIALHESIADAIRIICDEYPTGVTFSSSLGIEDQVITDIIFKNDLPVEVFTLDTGRLFQETYDLFDRTRDYYKKDIKIYFPDSKEIELFMSTKGANSFYHSVDARKECCNIRK